MLSEKHRDGLDDEESGDLMRDVGVNEGLGSDDQSPMTGDQQSGIQTYQFRSGDNGQVTYRVVQVGGSDENQQATLSIVTTNGIQSILSQGQAGGSTGNQQVALVGNPFNGENDGQTTNTMSDGQGTKFAYFPSTGSNPGDSPDIGTTADNSDQQNVAGGQFYVMMSPQDVLQTSQSRSLAPRNFVQKLDSGRGVVVRDTTRRVQHNEVERRRRDKINNWITKLSKLVPDCAADHTKQGQSKGGILAKTCDYIHDLQTSNQRYAENIKELERIQLDHEVLRIQLEDKKQENNILRQMLQSHGIEVAITSTSNTSH
uniref:Upstream stimulatory factor n=1 Tax=Phallusia mammillata TaxID=59560 RepID=A0A6F9DWN0_9ASCI|nr:upstream stimulatory factor [Phallusia mammillata]